MQSLAAEVGPLRQVLSDVAATRLSADTVLLTYRVVVEQTEGAGASSLRSSVWVRHDGEWLLRFHQGTPAASPGIARE